jgi:small subunit ribosomal protein S1
MEENALAATEKLDIEKIERKMHFTGKVIKTTLAGAVIDIGVDTPGVVHISQIQSEPINRVEDVIEAGQSVDVWVRRVMPKKKRIELTMIKPLDLEWREIAKDMVVKGTITRLEKFGAFVDIGAERPGLIHISEMTHEYIKSPQDFLKPGEEVEVKVLSVDRHKKQVKLSMKALEEPPKKVVKETKRPKVKEETPEEVEVIPTAMEMALRTAMEKSQNDDDGKVSLTTGKKSKAKSGELENILNRTLKQKVRTK